MAKMLSAKDIAIRAIETGEYPDVYCAGCDAWVPFKDLQDGEHCPRCRGQVEEAKSFKLGLGLLTPAEVEAAEDEWRVLEIRRALQRQLLEEYLATKDSAPADAQPVLKYGDQVLHAPQTSAPGGHA